MKDDEFAQLKLAASICPQAEQWPTQYTHWQKLGGAVAEARSRAGQTLAAMDVIDANADLTPEGKAKERARIAEKAINDFNKSDALQKARSAVEYMQARWAAKVDEVIKPAEDARTVALHAEIRGRGQHVEGRSLQISAAAWR